MLKSTAQLFKGAAFDALYVPLRSGFMHLREITGKRMISCTYEIGKVVT